jgi:hypothetical protein
LNSTCHFSAARRCNTTPTALEKQGFCNDIFSPNVLLVMGIVTALSITLLNNWTAQAQHGTAWHGTAQHNIYSYNNASC